MGTNNVRNTAKPKKRRRRVKVHYDRLFIQLGILAVIIFLIVLLVAKCDSTGDSDSTDNSEQTYIQAAEAGANDANKALETAPGSMDRDNALLEIRAREHQLRSKGHGHAADKYIESARKVLEEHDLR